MITKEDLLAHGFRPFPVPGDKRGWVTDALQKTIYGERKSEEHHKIYFITIYLWDFAGNEHARNKTSLDVRLYRLNRDGSHTSFELNVYPEPDWTVERLETFYADAYRALGCCPDALNN